MGPKKRSANVVGDVVRTTRRFVRETFQVAVVESHKKLQREEREQGKETDTVTPLRRIVVEDKTIRDPQKKVLQREQAAAEVGTPTKEIVGEERTIQEEQKKDQTVEEQPVQEQQDQEEDDEHGGGREQVEPPTEREKTQEGKKIVLKWLYALCTINT